MVSVKTGVLCRIPPFSLGFADLRETQDGLISIMKTLGAARGFKTISYVSLAVIYRDHQSNYFETGGVTAEKMKLDLLNRISSRLVKALEDLKFVKR